MSVTIPESPVTLDRNTQPATMDRNAQSVLHQRRSSIGRRARGTEAVEFFNVLTSPELLETTEAQLSEHRERLQASITRPAARQ